MAKESRRVMKDMLRDKEHIAKMQALMDQQLDDVVIVDGQGGDLPPANQEIVVETSELCIESLIDLRSRIVDEIGEKKGRKWTVELNNDDFSDEFLLRFLRARKFKVDRALELLHAHVDCKTEKKWSVSSLLASERVQRILKMGFISMPPVRDKYGRQVIRGNPGVMLSNIESIEEEEILSTYWVMFELALTDVRTQRMGITMIMNFADLHIPWAHIGRFKNMKPKILDLMINKVAVRQGSAFMFNQPWYFSFLFAIMKTFMKEKVARRFNLCGSNYEILQQHFEKSEIFAEFGGDFVFDHEKWANFVIVNERLPTMDEYMNVEASLDEKGDEECG